ncbi:MAG: EamA family transporter [Blautia sp.]|nr:EamA family transporter [Blautia sp.]
MKENTEKNAPGSLAMLTASMIIFGTIGVFRRFIPLSSGMIAFFRGIIGALFLLLFAKARGRRLRNGTEWKTTLWLAVSGGVIGFNWILLFEAYNYTTVSTATLCYYMQPTIVVIASTLRFKERMTWKKAVCSALALIGMILVSGVLDREIGSVNDLKGIFLGLGAAALYATVVLMNKSIRGIDAFEKTIIQLFAAGIVLIPYLAVTEDFGSLVFSESTILLLLFVSIIHTGISYAMYFGSMDGLRTQTVALFSYIDPITALVVSGLILHEKMYAGGMIGACLILGSAIACELL